VTGTALLAHQGGWDEILLVLTPMSLFAVLLYVANRRATRIQHDREESAPGGDDDAPPADDRAR
jgi:hypothetical protein